MKWQMKGHELEKEAGFLTGQFEIHKKIYLFGAGILGEFLLHTLKTFQCFGGFIDNDKQKQKGGFLGETVLSLDDYRKNNEFGWIVICASAEHSTEMLEQLCQEGISEKNVCFLLSEFLNRVFPIVSLYFYHQSFVALSQICLTERCTLKCRGCAHACYGVSPKAKDMDLPEAYKSADAFFSKVDFVQEFVLIGGEPLLYRCLSEVIAYVGEKYREQIGTFSITTNGTILPSKEVLAACRRYKILFRISNYSYLNPILSDKYAILIEMLKQNSVRYDLSKADHEWMDYGFDTQDRRASEQELTEAFDACKTPCHEVRGSKFYYCVMARSVSDNLEYHIGQEDFLDLNQLHGQDGKKILLEFNLGYSDKGYLDMCSHCNGADAKKYPIPAGEQIVKKGS